MCKRLIYLSFLVLLVGLACKAGAAPPPRMDEVTIGDDTPAGSSDYDEATQTLQVTGDGHDIWDTADDFHFVYKEWSGDCELIARVVSFPDGPNTWQKAGVMVRQDLSAGSQDVYMVITGNSDGAAGNGASFQWRDTANGGCGNSDSASVVTEPYYVRLVRTGNSFAGYQSPDGATWTQLGTNHTNAMTDPVYIGLCVTSHTTGSLVTATFDSLGGNLYIGPYYYASKPNPRDKQYVPSRTLPLTWTAGDAADQHKVYFSDNFDSVNQLNPAALKCDTTDTLCFVGMPPNPSLIPGTTYYWRVVEVNDSPGAPPGSPWVGPVWSFTVTPEKAWLPDPPNGGKFVPTEPTLYWNKGGESGGSEVYFGTAPGALTRATGGFVMHQDGVERYSYKLKTPPAPLAYNKTYYWRVDTYSKDFTKILTGDVWSFTVTKEGGGLRGNYYHWWPARVNEPPPQNPVFRIFVLSRIDPEINWNWGDPGSPDPAVNVDGFACRWTGEIEAAFTETYTFYMTTDDGQRLWIDGQLIIDHWVQQGMTEYSGTIDLVAGEKYSIEAWMYEHDGGAGAELRWSSPHTPKQIVPQGALSPPVRAYAPVPANGETDVIDTPTLSWMAGEQAAQHQVFFGTDRDAVAAADTTTPVIYKGTQPLADTNYAPTGPLEWDKTYYWKVNEVSGTDLWEGSVWSFTVRDYFLIEDFEPYDDYCNCIFYTWLDGAGYPGDITCGITPSNGNNTGSIVGNLYPPYAERNIVNSGAQAMPMEYLNDGSTLKALYSEASRTFATPMNWNKQGVHDLKSLNLSFRGQPGTVNSSSYNAVSDTHTLVARTGDIWGTSDQFRYVYKQLSGGGSIQAKVIAVTANPVVYNEWTKVGVMIREDLEPNSPHAFMMLGPFGRTALQQRPVRANNSLSNHSNNGKITFPYWVKIERVGNTFTGSYSLNGTTWVAQPNDENLDPDTTASNPATIQMNTITYIGLALTSNNTGLTVVAQLSNVTTSGTVTGQWQAADIGLAANDAEKLYVAVEDSSGTVQVVPHPDPDALLSSTYQEWNIPLTDFAPVNLNSVKKMYIGVGNRKSPTSGGGGMLYVDDIRLYESRCVASLAKPAGDFDNSCDVNYPDLDIMTNVWLVSTYDIAPDSSGLSTGLIGQYKLNGNLNDSVGGHNGTKQGVGAAVYVAGMDGQAIDLDGIDDFVYTDVNAIDLGLDGSKPKTVTAWAYTRSFNDGGIFDMGNNEDGRNFSLRTLGTTNVWRAQRYGYPTYDFDFEYDSLNKWVHFALVYNGAAGGNESWAYADGNLVGYQVAPMDTGTARNFGIGVWSGSYLFDGMIDEVRVYNRALSQAQVASLAGKTATFTQLMYPLVDPMDTNGMVDMNSDGTIDFKDCALLFDVWLEKKSWP
jgi:hypothetical protein